MPPEALRGFERTAVRLCDWINLNDTPKRRIQWYVRNVSARWTIAVTKPRWRLFDFEPIETVSPPRSVILVSNHRSFFDMYVALSILYDRTRWPRKLFFPVRWRFFYTNPVGFLVNLGVSGCAMWPPVFLDERSEALNEVGTDQMVHVLNEQGAVLGIHPEGTRNKTDDPYTLLPTKPGVGRLVHACPDDTLVIPFFMTGLTNDLIPQVWAVLRGKEVADIRVVWGQPVPARELRSIGDAQAIADALRDRITLLGQRERSLREEAP